MVRTSRRQTLLRTTLPAVEQAEPSEEAELDFTSQPADEADQQTAEADVEQETEQRIDADRLLPVLIQEMNLPQEAKDHLYQEIQRVRQCVHPSPLQIPPPDPSILMPRQVGTDDPPLCHRGSTHATHKRSNSSSGTPWPI